MVFSGFTIEELAKSTRAEPEIARNFDRYDRHSGGWAVHSRAARYRAPVDRVAKSAHSFPHAALLLRRAMAAEKYAGDSRRSGRDQCEWLSGRRCGRLVEGVETEETSVPDPTVTPTGVEHTPAVPPTRPPEHESSDAARDRHPMTRTAVPPTRPPEPDGPRQVSKFEFNLLRILRFLVGHFPADQGSSGNWCADGRQRGPGCLSGWRGRSGEGHAQEGVGAAVPHLRSGGAGRNDKFLRNNAPTHCRVWDSIPLDERALQFSRPVLDFLLWLTAEKVHETKQAWDVQHPGRSPRPTSCSSASRSTR